MTKALPALSQAVVAARGTMHVTQIQTGRQHEGLNPVIDIVAQVAAVLRSAGFDLGGLVPHGSDL